MNEGKREEGRETVEAARRGAPRDEVGDQARDVGQERGTVDADAPKMDADGRPIADPDGDEREGGLAANDAEDTTAKDTTAKDAKETKDTKDTKDTKFAADREVAKSLDEVEDALQKTRREIAEGKRASSDQLERELDGIADAIDRARDELRKPDVDDTVLEKMRAEAMELRQRTGTLLDADGEPADGE